MPSPSIVLFAEDPETIEMYRYLLKSDGYEVHTASCRDELVPLLSAEWPSAVLMDLRDSSGVALCRTIRSTNHGAELPIIAMTGWSRGPIMDAIRGARLSMVFLKPIEPTDLFAALRQCIGWSSTPSSTPAGAA